MPCSNPEKQKAAQAAWYRSVVKTRRTEWLAKNGPCRKCGSSENLEVDHIDPSDKEDHAVWSWSLERRTAELAKCQVLCSKCHLEKTLSQRFVSHCKRGHPFDLFNTYFRNGWRECRACHNLKRARQRREKRAAA